MDERRRLRDARKRGDQETGNPYIDAARGVPSEIVDYEFATDPYANMLPGVSNVRGMRSIAEGAFGRGHSGWSWTRVVALVLIILFVVLPVVIMFSSYLLPGQ